MTTRVLIIDNYDSFTYNLAAAIAGLPGEPEVQVRRHDAVNDRALAALDPTHLIISPGPGRPAQAGCSNTLIAAWSGKIPILGVCLGHQCIAEVFGAGVIGAPRCMHGKTSLITHDGKGIFSGLANPFRAMRYHSLIVDTEGMDAGFKVTARSEDGVVMAISDRPRAIDGVQFHPESFATDQGQKLLENFLLQCRATKEKSALA